jgi:3-phenylpropionate/trans-cinnamate dioxygenase ferredoxin subunit
MSHMCRRVQLGHRADLTGGLQRFDIDGRPIVLIDLGQELVALDDTCSHENASLTEEGELDAEAREIECCRHGARFSLDDGSARSLPASSGLHTYRVEVQGDAVYIELTP